MPNYQILLFGICKDLLGQATLEHVSTENLSVSDLLQALKSAHPSLDQVPSLRLAANHQFPNPDEVLFEGMEIALIPPVSGG